ncbi:alpha-2,8-polysialyltransferase family protein [Microbacterium sp. M28]|uniref:alpha-2,8-polysialyltransferase family protein n=1 Tax=Microbacterium sp. M28 TaxID=2962064 RepID=UPI0021F4D3FC|nr:alpha-2,8-polysialyltransferase family protein [Microbacterium sp. M28]UYO97118.1 alpha-2,8-polysialyltransferase family protein [Microbacterium sp. M28]
MLHSAYGLATAAAAIDAQLFDDDHENVLVPVNTARVPETSTGIDAQPGLASLRGRFSRSESLDELLSPRHPSSWKPDAVDLPVLRRLLTSAWRLDDDLELCVQSPQVAPAKTLLALFPDARITIIGDGLMTYSPIRVDLGRTVVERVGRVVYADVVPGVAPLVFTEVGAERVPVPAVVFRDALAETVVADPALDELADGTRTVLVLGQYLAALDLVEPAEEIAMQQEMIDRAVASDPARIVFKPHPSAPPAVTSALRQRARRHGVTFAEYRGPTPAELVAERLDAAVVVAGFSTALPTVRTLYDRSIASAGLDTVLARLSPYENSNRVPATIVDALTRDDSGYRDPARLQLLVDAVGYAMQPRIAAHLRPRAERLLTELDAAERDRYFVAERLIDLDLPGAPREKLLRRALRSQGGVGRIEEARLTVAGARRRAARAWKAVTGR